MRLRRKRRFVRCPECNSKIFAEREVCPGCGRIMLKPKKKRNKKLTAIIIAVLSVAVVLAVVLSARYIIRLRTEISVDVHLKADKKLSAVTDQDGFVRQSIENRKKLVESELKKLTKDELIEKYTFNDENRTFEFTYGDGSYGAVMISTFDKALSGADKGYAVLDDKGDLVINNRLDETARANVESLGLKAKVFGFYTDKSLEQWVRKRTEIWNANGLKTELDTDVTMKELETALKSEDMIFLDGHGFIYKKQAALCFGEAVTEKSLKKYSRELRSGQLFELIMPKAKYYCARPQFFSTQYSEDELSGRMVFINACRSADSDRLTKTFRQLGVKGLIAVNGDIYSYYIAEAEDALVYSLLCGDSVQQALDYALSIYGADDLAWAREFDGTPDVSRKLTAGKLMIITGGEHTLK